MKWRYLPDNGCWRVYNETDQIKVCTQKDAQELINILNSYEWSWHCDNCTDADCWCWGDGEEE